MTNNKKEVLQYSTAIGTLITGIVMCFISFFLNEYDIEHSVLMYFGETLIFCAGVFGVNLYINDRIMQTEQRIDKKIQDMKHK